MIRSLRVRLMLAATTLAVLFMLGLLPAMQGAFSLALQDSIEQRLASDVTTLISAARVENNRLLMPAQLPDERFNLTDSRLLGYIYDREGHLVWRSRATQEENINYKPRYDGRGNEFARIREANGQEFFVYDVEVKLLGGKSAAFSIVALQPVREYQLTLEGLRENLYLGFGAALLVLLTLLWLGLTWGLQALRRLSQELDQIEGGTRESLSEEHPRELLRLTGSLNRLLHSEREQRTRYRDSLDDLAHSLKTRLALIQITAQELKLGHDIHDNINEQITTMDQIIQYQLRRAVTGRKRLASKGTEPVPLIEKLLASLTKVYRHKKLQTGFQFDDDVFFHGEQGDLMELMGNLLDNACKFAISEIRVHVGHQDNGLLIVVEDDGPGIAPGKSQQIFQRGVRADSSPGQGIGLAVVTEIVHSYGGKIRVDESPLGGARFHITLP